MTFASAAFLTGLALLTIPWWLHRQNAHAAEQRTFSSLFLMRPSEAPVNMRKQLQHRILLALRWLLLIAACLAFAEPVLRFAGTPATEDETSHHRLLVIDTSLSMARADGAPLEAAKLAARELIGEMPAGTRAALVTAADRLELVVPLTDDRARLSGALATINPSATRLMVTGLMGRISTLADTLLEPGERLNIHFLSDFQASGMPDQFNALISGAVWPTILSPMVEADTPAPNRAIASLRPTDDGRLEVTVRSFNAPGNNVEVTLIQNDTVADSEVGTESLSVPENGSAIATFTLPDAAGDRGRRAITWTATLNTSDALDADNVRRLVKSDAVTTALPVLTDDNRAWAYLRAAVHAAAPRFLPERITELNNPAVPVIVILDPGVLAGGMDRILNRYLETGGAVLMAVGSETRAAGRIPLIERSLKADRFSQSPRGAAISDRSHPALTGFSGWQDLIFFQALSTADENGTDGEVILTLDDGTPLLTEYRIGTGRLMLLGTAFDPGWSTLVVRPAFVGFMANLLGYLAEDLLPAEALVGQPFAIPAQNVQLFDTNGERVLGLSETIGRPTVSLSEPGIYQLRTPSSTRYLAVNTSLAESDLTRISDEQLQNWRSAADRTIDHVAAHEQNLEGGAQPDGDAAAERELNLAPWLLALLALLVMIEPIYANLFSERSSRGQPGRQEARA